MIVLLRASAMAGELGRASFAFWSEQAYNRGYEGVVGMPPDKLGKE